MSDVEDNSTPTVAALKPLEIGQYDPTDAEAWFAQAETLFSMRNITLETKKAQLLIQALPRKLYKLLWPTFDFDASSASYTKLKEELLDLHGMSSAERAKQIFSFIGSSHGDMTPSMILRTLQNLQNMPKTRTRAAGKVDLLMEITLQCLPKEVTNHLPDYTRIELKDFLLKADALALAHKNEKPILAAARTYDTDTSDSFSNSEQVAAPLQRPANSHKRKQRAYNRSSSRRRNNSHNNNRRRSDRNSSRNRSHETPPVCFYHRKFGASAFKCTLPCDFKPKNAH